MSVDNFRVYDIRMLPAQEMVMQERLPKKIYKNSCI